MIKIDASVSRKFRQNLVMRILNAMAKQSNTAIIVVTHDEKIIPTFKRIYHIRDGVTHEEVGEGRSIGESAAQLEVEVKT